MASSRVKPRVLVTGGSGFLAINWACAIRDSWEVLLATHRHRVVLDSVSAIPLSLDDVEALERELNRIRPSLIIHTAGLTDVDRCEADPAASHAANAVLARNVAQSAANQSVRLVHISTDHLFTGDRPMVSETENVHPINEYARSKRLAEQYVLATCPNALIVRTNFFGWGHANRRSFSDWVIYSLRAGETISVFDDVYFSPILADGLVRWAHELVARGASGIYNICGDERMSKYEFAMRLAAQFKLPPKLIRKASVKDAALRAPRPCDMSLDNTKASHATARVARTLEADLAELLEQEAAGRRDLLLRAVSG
jgi:dTDP-4-dehydrorhamnose reductase